MTAAHRPLPKVRKTPMWVPTMDGFPCFWIGLFDTKRDAEFQATCEVERYEGEAETVASARRVWIALEPK